MRTLIFRTIAPYLSALMMIFSVFVLLRGHNDPGGGFIGGLLAASAFAIYGIASGVASARRAMRFHPMVIAGSGLAIAVLAGLASILFGVPFMTGLWAPPIPGIGFEFSSVLFFDLGVYLVVLGAVTSIALALEERDEE
ncbi:MAG: Na+/H+ antiporter subunit B [Rhizobiaceae bacterium]|nr:Na+/H+ antiporter subunit B [Rhizobiaceae bacterium]